MITDKFYKCEFWLREVQFLGHVISKNDVQVDHKKIEEVMKWDPTKKSSEIHSFIGLAGYYRRFIERFSLIATSLPKPTRKN